MTGNTYMHLLVTNTVKKKKKSRGVVRKPVYLVCSATHLLRIELIRLLIVASGMLSHSSSMALQSCWLLVGTGTRWSIQPAHTITPPPPWHTLFTMLTSAKHSPTKRSPYTLSAICPVQLKLGLIREEHTSPACQWPSKVSIWWAFAHWSQLQCQTAIRSRPW